MMQLIDPRIAFAATDAAGDLSQALCAGVQLEGVAII